MGVGERGWRRENGERGKRRRKGKVEREGEKGRKEEVNDRVKAPPLRVRPVESSHRLLSLLASTRSSSSFLPRNRSLGRGRSRSRSPSLITVEVGQP